ncbi:uncharacterized protein LOC127841598 [Dreissena polymorpha]|uniref:Uncharacterized protein n=1 Tax=Dreissena polymorpha TaxID=45954 RepID=A0A9D4S0M4_DREPO|nr:uncharacterized protein LOC127841598 [Dreissena polymorpha]KAH3886080.1 hypothetical protein DPMN_010081 [Dreissena polymorpha]
MASNDVRTHTPSPTPSEENRKNARDDMMKNALEMFMNKSSQSYDDFLKSFTTLKESKPDVVPSLAERKKLDKSLESELGDNKCQPTSVNIEGPVKSTRNIVNDIKRRKMGKVIVQKGTNPGLQEEEIEEQVLGNGEVSNRLAHSNVIRTGRVKVDNFVETEDDDESLLCEYNASFSAGSISSHSSKLCPAHCNTQSGVDKDVMSIQSSSVTDKLLMDFMMDLQNELEGRSDVTNSNLKTDHINGQLNTSADIQAFIQTKHKRELKKTVPNEGRNADKSESGDELVDFDDDESDAALTLCDETKNENVEVKIKPGELELMANDEKGAVQSKLSKLNDIYKHALMDSEGVMQTAAARHPMEEGTATEEYLARETTLLFPGQIEEQDNVMTQTRNTLLDFKAIYKEPSLGADKQVDSHICDTSVEAFQLDETFDYDNVVLTPKFSMEDMTRLKQMEVVMT